MSRFKLYSLQLLLVAAALVLSIDVWMQTKHAEGLCATEGCKVAGEYVRFGELSLIIAGAAFYWFVWLLSFFAGRYDRIWLWNLILLLVLGAMAFDGGLLGFQLTAVQEKCLLCMVVAAFLFLASGLLAWCRKSLLIFALACAVWAGGFASTSALDYRHSAIELDRIEVISKKADPEHKWPRFYFFFGLHCGHCSEVLANLAVNNRDPFFWHLIPLNDKKEDLYRVRAILGSDEREENVFMAVLRVESTKDADIEPRLPPERTIEQIEKAKQYFSGRGFRGVPVLIVRENPGKKVVLEGKNSIMRYLKQKKLVVRTVDLSGLTGEGKDGQEGE
ncbi:MAG: vitamin K epoxide reductase family protein [Desulfonatronovibrionaceae bacterium]